MNTTTPTWLRRAAPSVASAALISLALAGCGSPQTGPKPANGDPDATVEPVSTAAPTAAEDTGPSEPDANLGAATDFTLPSLEGKTIRLSDYRGKKVVLIDFWATTCDPCLQEMPELVKLYKKYKKKGFIVLAISTDGPETQAQVRTIVSDKKMSFPILLDEETEVLDQYNPKGELPYTVLVDRDGNIVLERASYQAGDEDSLKSLKKAIKKALKKK